MASIPWDELIATAEQAFKPIPDGPYLGRAVDCEYKPTAKGKPMWNVKFEIVGGPYAGKAVYTNIVLSTEKAAALVFFFEHMATLGLDRNYLMSNPDPDDVSAAIISAGKVVSLEVGHREWNEKVRNTVEKFKPANGQVPTPVPDTPSTQSGGAASADSTTPF